MQLLLEKHKRTKHIDCFSCGSSKITCRAFRGIEIENVWDDPFMHSASLSIIEFEEGIGKVKQFADISHFQ